MVNIVRKDNVVDRNISFQIYVDNALIGDIMNEEKKNFNIREGHHTIQIRCHTHKSKVINFDVAEGEIIEFGCEPMYKDNLFSKITHQVFGNDIKLELNGDYFI